jgi:hypothetical protein
MPSPLGILYAGALSLFPAMCDQGRPRESVDLAGGLAGAARGAGAGVSLGAD